MALTNVWVGAVTPSSAKVIAKVTGSSTRLAVASNAALTSPSYYGPVVPDAQGIVAITATGLVADTQYWYAIEDDSVLDLFTTGKFRTHPTIGEPATFTFAASGDGGLTPDFPGEGAVLASSQLSNHPVFDTIRAHDPLFFVHLGDLHYYDLGSGLHGIGGGATVANYRRALDDVLLQSRQHQLYREVPLVYIWDDHDYGPDNSDGTFADKAHAQQVYRERVPSYPLADPEGIFHSFQVGRVLFIAADSRSDRSPDTDPDTPAKTMLGPAQMSWLQQVLSTSTASALCWLMQVEWLGSNNDSWGGFHAEQDVLLAMLDQYGWLPRMWMLNADKHSLGIDSGANNQYGAFPIYLLASLDATPGSSTGPYDRGITGGRNQYGLITVEDFGDRIDVTGVGYAGSSELRRFRFTISAEITPPTVPPASPAIVVQRLVWLGCNLVAGDVIAELPEVSGAVSRLLGAATSTSLQLAVPLGGFGSLPIQTVEQATELGRTMVVAVVNDVPRWAGIPLVRTGGSEATLELGLVTLEGYLDRRYVGGHTWTQQDDALVIAAGLAADAQVEGIGLFLDVLPSGTKRDRAYLDSDDATVYSRMQELMAVQGGPEWTIDLEWSDDTHTAVAKILRIRARIGVASTNPRAVFSTRGQAEARYTFSEDYSSGRGANHVVATGSGEGTDRPQSAPARDTALLAAGWPRFEQRFSPSTSISSLSVLSQHAAAELARRRNGAIIWELEARWDAYPRLGIDWDLGDEIGWDLVGHRHPDGVQGVGRCIGWELDAAAGLIRPILLDPTAG